LESNFVPATPKATDLFVEKQKFFYPLFHKVLLTDKGKSLVRQYASTFSDLTVMRLTLPITNDEGREDILDSAADFDLGTVADKLGGCATTSNHIL
jgi:hypothetical protein